MSPQRLISSQDRYILHRALDSDVDLVTGEKPSKPSKRGLYEAAMKLHDWHYKWASKVGQPEYMKWDRPHGVKKWYGKAKGMFKPKGGSQVKPDLSTRGLSGDDD